MTSDEFWKDDPNLFLAYHTSFINKKKKEYEEWNYKSWLQGLYIYKGNSVLTRNVEVSIFRSQGGKVQYSKDTYPSKPFDLTGEEKKEKTKEEKQKEYFNSFNYFGSLKQRFVERVKKGE